MTERARKDENRFCMMHEEVPDSAAFMLDSRWVVTSWNSSATRLTGYEPAEVVGKRFGGFLLEEEGDRGGNAADLATAIATGRSESEGWRVRKDGSRFWANVLVIGLSDNGRQRVFMAVVRDMTVRHEVQEGLLAENRRLRAFNCSVAHELRSPLQTIYSSCELLLGSHSLDSQNREDIDRLNAAAGRISKRIEALLRLAHHSHGELHLTNLDMSSLARTVAERIREKNPLRQVHLVIQEGLVARGNAQLAEDLLENLLDNAWKYTSRHRSARIEVGATWRHGQTVFFVRDDGVGFDSAKAGNIFGLFHRMHSEREFEGAGIGLALVRQIVERHGGLMSVEAERERGATFFFTLAPERKDF